MCYYINFQLPYTRSNCGFDTLDLELDLIVQPSLSWKLKDEDIYLDGIKEGFFQDQWVSEVERARPEIIEMINNQQYPFDGSWIDWHPHSEWNAPSLPKGWAEV